MRIAPSHRFECIPAGSNAPPARTQANILRARFRPRAVVLGHLIDFHNQRNFDLLFHRQQFEKRALGAARAASFAQHSEHVSPAGVAIIAKPIW